MQTNQKIIKIISATVTVDSINHAPSVYIAWTENIYIQSNEVKNGIDKFVKSDIFCLFLS